MAPTWQAMSKAAVDAATNSRPAVSPSSSPAASATARSVGKITALACTAESSWVSSHSHQWAITPPTNAAEGAGSRRGLPATELSSAPPQATCRARRLRHSSLFRPARMTPAVSISNVDTASRASPGMSSHCSPAAWRANRSSWVMACLLPPLDFRNHGVVRTFQASLPSFWWSRHRSVVHPYRSSTTCGLITSLRPSPIRLVLSTARKISSPGNMAAHHANWMKGLD